MSPLRKCSRTTCQQPAVATLTYQYAEATAVIGPLSPVASPGTFDLCEAHAESVTALIIMMGTSLSSRSWRATSTP
ncbi:DUF3499 family protein, partial [Actinotignum timonense]|uniref:DUF3499 family protein n=1 Tax=Actinotignum timonense TaxID=1870995 RepID=UPI002A80D2B5